MPPITTTTATSTLTLLSMLFLQLDQWPPVSSVSPEAAGQPNADGHQHNVSSRRVVSARDLVIVILSQAHPYHEGRAGICRDMIISQSAVGGKEVLGPEVILLHDKWPNTGSWTIVPILDDLSTTFGANSSWIMFIEEETRIDLNNLTTLLNTFDYNQELFLGKALTDSQPTIIHHFAFHDNPSIFKYPDTAAGFIISTTLLNKLALLWSRSEHKPNFSTDMKHEFSLFILGDGDSGVALTDLSQHFCTKPPSTSHNQCVTTYTQYIPQCGDSIDINRLYFAVKTCSKYHEDRIPIIQQTWARDVTRITYYSDISDPDIPTLSLGIPNTDRGHCEKTFRILSHVISHNLLTDDDWFILADDDTLFSVSRLRQLLACYSTPPRDADGNTGPVAVRLAVALGERYAYAATAGYGYDYITSGGGLLLNAVTVRRVVEAGSGSNNGHCSCPQADSPDDMLLGMCLKYLNIPVTHSPLFHQARPEDYSADYLSHQLPVSFHKFWQVDPLRVYDQWLASHPHSPHTPGPYTHSPHSQPAATSGGGREEL